MRTLGNPSKPNSRLKDVLLTIENEIELLALSEVRWPGRETVQIKERLILYPGHLPEQGHQLAVRSCLTSLIWARCKEGEEVCLSVSMW